VTQPPGYEPPPGQPSSPAHPPSDQLPPPGYAPPGYAPPGNPPPGNPPPGYPPPGYAPPGYAPPGYAPPGYAPPGYAPGPAGGYPPYAGYWPPPVSPSGQPLSDFGTRLVAYLIDSVLLAFVVGIVVFPLFFVFVWRLSSRVEDLPASDQNPSAFIFSIVAVEFGLFLFSLLCQYLYTVELLVRWNGQTLGKRIMKIRVISVQPGVPLTRSTAAKRFLVTAAGAVVPALPLLDGLWQLWDKPLRQCLHDKAAETVVVVSPTAPR
jgi:uncharacterized RDD family membrane protein YckC